MISERISDDIPPQMKILNMVIPILVHICSFVSNWSVARRIMLHGIQRNVTNFYDAKTFPAVYRRIYCRKYMTLSNQKLRVSRACALELMINVVKQNASCLGYHG